MFILSWIFEFLRDSLLSTVDSWFSFLPFSIWSVVWQGFALWYAARNRQIAWFILCLVLSWGGVVPMLYLSLFKKDKNLPPDDVKSVWGD